VNKNLVYNPATGMMEEADYLVGTKERKRKVKNKRVVKAVISIAILIAVLNWVDITVLYQKWDSFYSQISSGNLNMVGIETSGEVFERYIDSTVDNVRELEVEESAVMVSQVLQFFNFLASNAQTVEQIFIIGTVGVGEDRDVVPGIYDVKILGGSGNITGNRSNWDAPFINWVGSSPNAHSDFPSIIRMILFEGDELEFTNISQVSFIAVSETVELSNELGIGEFVVGRDIKPGLYELDTNIALDSRWPGWSIDIYNFEASERRSRRSQSLNPASPEVRVLLEEGEILSISLSNSVSTDEARLIFNPLD